MTGVAALLLYLYAFSLAYQGLDAGVGALILFGTVQITMFAVAVTQRENIPWTRWVGAGLACLGLVWLLFPGAEGAVGDLTSMALMAAAGIGWGIYSLAGRHEPDALAATAANFVLSVPIALVLIQLLPMPASELPIQSLGIVLAIASGALTSGLGYALWYTILPRLGATRAATAQLSVPVIALAGGALILGEMPTLQFLVAALVVLGGVALSLRPTK